MEILPSLQEFLPNSTPDVHLDADVTKETSSRSYSSASSNRGIYLNASEPCGGISVLSETRLRLLVIGFASLLAAVAVLLRMYLPLLQH